MEETKPSYKIRKQDMIPIKGMDVYRDRNNAKWTKDTFPRELTLYAYNVGVIASAIGLSAVGLEKLLSP